MENILIINNISEFRKWLLNNHKTQKECWIKNLKRGKPVDNTSLYYIDALEEALCFGWIDSIYKKVDGILYQRFSPRSKKSNWTILNKARVNRLISLNKMTPDGLLVVPNDSFIFNEDIIKDLKNNFVWEIFKDFPILYQQIKISNLESIKKNSIEKYNFALSNLIRKTKEGKMLGEWNDYGRLDDRYKVD